MLVPHSSALRKLHRYVGILRPWCSCSCANTTSRLVILNENHGYGAKLMC
jgi:hypothetical protein